LKPVDLKVPILTPFIVYLKNVWKNQKNKMTGKYTILIHDEGLEFNIISQVKQFTTLPNIKIGIILPLNNKTWLSFKNNLVTHFSGF
jgi:hypothetical protein